MAVTEIRHNTLLPVETLYKLLWKNGWMELGKEEQKEWRKNKECFKYLQGRSHYYPLSKCDMLKHSARIIFLYIHSLIDYKSFLIKWMVQQIKQFAVENHSSKGLICLSTTLKILPSFFFSIFLPNKLFTNICLGQASKKV